MLGDDQLLDSYQNLVCGPAGNQSVEAIGTVSHVNGYMEAADIHIAHDSPWESDEDAERIAGDLSSEREEGDAEHRQPEGHESDERNEPDHAHHDGEPMDGHEGGRAASGEPFEDEADNALFRQERP